MSDFASNLENVVQRYNLFRQSEAYESRNKQRDFVNQIAQPVLKKFIEKDSISTDNLTSLIQIFKENCTKENFTDRLRALNFDDEFTNELINRFEQINQRGYTGAGLAIIKDSLKNEELETVLSLLKDVYFADSEENIKLLVKKYIDADIPMVKHGIFSPWIHYMHPNFCPIVNSVSVNYLKSLGLDNTNFLTVWEAIKQVKEKVGEEDFGFVDCFFYTEMGKSKYWLFIVPKNYEQGKLWEYCRNNSIAAMDYQKESDSPRTVNTNLNQIKKIKDRDKVVVYINDNTIGGVGEVIKTFYEDSNPDNGLNGKFAQRIGLEWMADNFEVNIKPLKPQLNNFPTSLNLKTIHELDENDFNKIIEFVKTGTLNISTLLNMKKQIILYGPPGTGKTFLTKRIAVSLINQN